MIGSALYLDYGSPGTGVGALTVGGNVAMAGNISLGNQIGGDPDRRQLNAQRLRRR